MAPVSFNAFSDSPILVLSPQEPPRPFLRSAPFDEPDNKPLTPGNFSQWTPSASKTPIPTAPSRKRSRAEITADDPDTFSDGSYFPSTASAPPTIPEQEPIYGEGMTLLNPTSGIVISAESQTGTWFEEREEAVRIAAARGPTASLIQIQKTALASRKSQRLDTSAPGLDDITLCTISQAGARASSPPKSSAVEPLVDDFTHLLGIGWTRLRDDDADIQAAARGWAKYINNHYPVREAQILLESAGLNAYLVGTTEGFYLFKEDLSEGQLVGRDWGVCLANLRSSPMNLEGPETLRAARPPSPGAGSANYGAGSGTGSTQAAQVPLSAPLIGVGHSISESHDGLGGVMELD